ncbi:hypothetical protein [Hymenobacter persicinus]|uniref:Uncharacterized protein n=1 Tax=Hymenobacter persicinus TaxID=2025506 RepID=A0A4Q5LAU8_9BACT|nr:hypothetical protein [Hymenobacter persicinus]RYU79172.1 hypothetical protein EWM57_11615 [Hymenobacter persicinus]
MKTTYCLLLTAATLLTACSKKEEVLPPEIDYSAPVAASGYIAYNLDGVVATRPATARYEAAGVNHPTYDWLIINGVNPATNTGVNTLIYAKPPGAPDDQYRMFTMSVEYPFPSLTSLPCTLVKTGAGWSGTFASDFTPMKSSITYKLRSGTFTNIK